MTRLRTKTFTAYDFDQYASNGLGAELAAGIPRIEHSEFAPNFPGEGEERHCLPYVWVVADPRLIDKESPIRRAGYANDYRPHGPLIVRVFEARVRAARRISDLSSRPFDFTVDATDAQNSAVGIAHLGSMDAVQFTWRQQQLATADFPL